MTIYEANFMAMATPIIEMYCDGNERARFYNACSEYFNYSQKVRPNKLLDCSSKNLLPIGCAFAILSLEIDFGNEDINSIAAENALYCLLTHRKHAPKSFGDIPYNAAVSLLLSESNVMHDGLMYVLGNHFSYVLDLSGLEKVRFRSGENSVRSRILKYLIPHIFDVDKLQFKFDDLPLAPGREQLINYVNSSFYKNANGLEGEELLEELYDFCRQGVSQP